MASNLPSPSVRLAGAQCCFCCSAIVSGDGKERRVGRKGIARNVAGDPETDAFEQGAAHSSGTVDVEPWPNEFLTDSRPNMRDEVVDSPPERMTRPSFKQDRVRRTVAAAKEAAGSDGPQPAFAAPGTPRQAAQIATSTTPATGYGAAAPASRSGGESIVKPVALPMSGLPRSSIAQRPE